MTNEPTANELHHLAQQHLEDGAWLAAFSAFSRAYLGRADAFQDVRDSDAAMFDLQARLAREHWRLQAGADGALAWASLAFEEWLFVGLAFDEQSHRAEWERLESALAPLDRLKAFSLGLLLGESASARASLADLQKKKPPVRADLELFAFFLDARDTAPDERWALLDDDEWADECIEAGLSLLDAWRGKKLGYGASLIAALRRAKVSPILWGSYRQVVETGTDLAALLDAGAASLGAVRLLPYAKCGGLDAADTIAFARANIAPEIAAAFADLDVSAETAQQLQQNAIYRVRPVDVAVWRAQGVAADEIVAWMEVGFVDPVQVKAHREAGRDRERSASRLVALADIGDWRACGFSDAAARLWSLAGFAPRDAQRFASAGLYHDDAAPWAAAGLEPRTAAAWRGIDLPADKKVTLALEGVKPAHAKYLLDDELRAQWKETAFPIDDAALLARDGVSPADARPWAGLGLKFVEVKNMLRQGIDPLVVRQFRELGFDKVHEILNWDRCGLSAKEARSWADAGFSNHEAEVLKKVGAAAELSKPYKDAGVPLTTARDFVSIGLAYSRVQPFLDRFSLAAQLRTIGVDDVNVWLDAGFPFGSGIVPWARAGVSPAAAFELWRHFVPVAYAQRSDVPAALLDAIGLDRTETTWDKKLPSALKKAVNKMSREGFIEQWVELGYPEDGWSLDDSWPWANAGIEAVFARAWRREGCDVETARRWIAVGHDTPKYVADSIAEGQTLEVLEARPPAQA